MELEPDLASATLRVAIRASGEPQGLQSWTLAGEPALAAPPSFMDAQGAIPASCAAQERRFSCALGRPPEGEVRVAYVLGADGGGPESPLSLSITPDQVRASGRAVLLLPRSAEATRLPVRLRIVPRLPDAPDAATSFGFGGDHEIRASAGELRATAIVAGRLGRARFEDADGVDEAAWLGFTTFDPRLVAAEVAAFRSGAAEVFGDRAFRKEMLLVASDGREGDAFRAARRAGGVSVFVGVGQPWSASLKISVAQAVVQHWLGERLSVEDPARSGSGGWFAEGFARFAAGELLARFGLISPDELAGEVNGLLARVALGDEDRDGLALVTARGALFARKADAAIRARSAGRRSLFDLLRAKLAGSPGSVRLTEAAWLEALAADAGPDVEDAFDRALHRRAPIELGTDALGPCFRPSRRRLVREDLGFDLEATLRRSGKAVVGLRAGGPAERAGMREGDRLEDGAGPPTGGAWDLRVRRSEELVALRIRPTRKAALVPRFERTRGRRDEPCAPAG